MHATCDAEGWLCDILLTPGEASDYKGAEVQVKWFLADVGYDGDWVRSLLESMGITPAIHMEERIGRFLSPTTKKRCKKRHKIENAFAKLKDWRRVKRRYDRCLEIFFSACAFAAAVIWWV